MTKKKSRLCATTQPLNFTTAIAPAGDTTVTSKPPNTLGRTPQSTLVALAAFVVILAGMRYAAPILVPLLIAIFITILLSPLHSWLRERGVYSALSLALVLAGLLGLVIVVGLGLGNSAQDFSQNLPLYRERLTQMAVSTIAWLGQFGIQISSADVLEYVNPGDAIAAVGTLISRAQSMLANSLFIFITVALLLAELPGLPHKLRSAASSGASEKNSPLASLKRFRSVAEKVNRYMALKALISLATGVLVAVSLVIIGVDFPVLWGVLAFFLNFIPAIGSILAAIPAVLLALVQLGVGEAAATVAVYLAINIVIGNVVEPRFMGQRLGLSTLVVFLSLVFWGWLLGSVGMLLSVPLTIAAKIALEANPETRWLGVLLSDKVSDG